MENIIFYFTGTGNSLAVARDIADKLGDTKLVSIADAIKEDNIDLSYMRIGFVFPVYYSNVPVIVKHFIEKLRFNKAQYIFGVMTFGGTYVTTLSKLNQYVTGQGGSLSAGFSVHMPGNYIVKYGAFPKPLQQILLKGVKKKVNKISIALKEKKVLFKAKEGSVTGFFAEIGNKSISEISENAHNFHVNNNCTGCSSCSKVCPVDNIKMENRQPKWGTVCEQCMACIQWCPAHAIEYADKTAKRKRYHHPDIKISDFI